MFILVTRVGVKYLSGRGKEWEGEGGDGRSLRRRIRSVVRNGEKGLGGNERV